MYSSKLFGLIYAIEDLLRSETLDFVIIAIPHYLHKDIIEKAIKHRARILKEKPFAVSLAEANEIKNLAEISLTIFVLRAPLKNILKRKGKFLLGSALQVFGRSGGLQRSRAKIPSPSNSSNFCPLAYVLLWKSLL